ncbi:DUF4910 domain-containing protein [Candidatus Parcubacteria bacterium]|nr:DUF4910 domain-containing protein [Candidatus Parcubacteria bacterium]
MKIKKKDINFNINTNKAGEEMFDLIKKLYPINRSITGNGVRETLKIIKEYIPLKVHEIPTGIQVFDWVIPKEWNIKDAYIKNSKGEKIVDFKKSNLHILGYSIPVHKKMALSELKERLLTLPNYPDWIPYRTSYYKKDWGFCLPYNQYKNLKDDIYEVFIDSTLENGSLSYGEFYLKGETNNEILFSCYTCHPSLCNDNLSGIALLTFLAKNLMKNKRLKYSYRFLFVPETIGSIAWLSANEDKAKKIKHGLVATCVGDSGDFTYKKTRNGRAEIDRVVENVLKNSQNSYKIIDFKPFGSDERQFNSPGFNLPVGSLSRTIYGSFPEYHTSADNLNFVKCECMNDSLNKYLDISYILENNKKYLNLNPKCELQLGKRIQYPKTKKSKDGITSDDIYAMLWILNLSDGNNSLLDISERSEINFKKIKKATDLLLFKGLLKEL